MYNFKQIDEHSYHQIQELYSRSFGSDHSIETIQKKYDTTCFGIGTIGFIAQDEHQDNAAYYGVFPMRLKYNSVDYIIAQSGDTMTAPEHRKKGLFTLLAKETYKASEENGLHFVFGFPNDLSYPGFKKKLDWVFTGNMQRFTIENPTLPMSELSTKFSMLEGKYRKYANSKLSKYSIVPTEKNIQIFDKMNTDGYIMKDSDFFEYKLRNPDNKLIEYEGFTMLIKAKTHLIIGAVGYFEKSKTDDFIKSINSLAKQLKCKKTVISLSPNHWLCDYLKLLIAPVDCMAIGFYHINKEIKIENLSFTQADYDTF